MGTVRFGGGSAHCLSVIHRLCLPLKGGDVMSNGRRRGRAMRPKRLALIEELLPKLALSVVTDDRGELVPLELADVSPNFFLEGTLVRVLSIDVVTALLDAIAVAYRN